MIFKKKIIFRKRYGQNFLIDQFVIDSIISNINPKKEHVMVEIGPGLAALTRPMIKHLNHLIAIEIDHDLVKYLQNHPYLKSKLTIYQQNAVDVNFNDLSKKMDQSLRIFGNIPYNISTSLIFHLFKFSDIIVDMHFMLQKEIADRLVAKPNNKTYGRLSIMTQYYCEVTPLIEVLPTSFIPSPKVKSTVVRLVPHVVKPYLVEDLYALNYIIAKAFSQRRKKICNSLKNILTANMFVKLGIDPTIRAENIPISQFCQMANYVSQHALL